MQIKTETITPQSEGLSVTIDVDARDVFVLVLVPNNLNDVEVCGRTISNWVDCAVAPYNRKSIQIKRSDDIIGLVKDNVKDEKYCVVVYADTPLIKLETIEQALSFAVTYDHKVVQLPRGWIFEINFIKGASEIKAVSVPNLEDSDFTVAYNFSQIALITTYMRHRINAVHMQNGVHITDPYNVYIDVDVEIGEGTKIEPGVVLRGDTTVGKNCYIGSGVSFCNFDGKKKHPISIGDEVFIGDSSNLVAPLVIGDKAHIGVGSTITQDVPMNALALARARQAVKEDWQ